MYPFVVPFVNLFLSKKKQEEKRQAELTRNSLLKDQATASLSSGRSGYVGGSQSLTDPSNISSPIHPIYQSSWSSPSSSNHCSQSHQSSYDSGSSYSSSSSDCGSSSSDSGSSSCSSCD